MKNTSHVAPDLVIAAVLAVTLIGMLIGMLYQTHVWEII